MRFSLGDKLTLGFAFLLLALANILSLFRINAFYQIGWMLIGVGTHGLFMLFFLRIWEKKESNKKIRKEKQKISGNLFDFLRMNLK